jgi:hypothetical protein
VTFKASRRVAEESKDAQVQSGELVNELHKHDLHVLVGFESEGRVRNGITQRFELFLLVSASCGGSRVEDDGDQRLIAFERPDVDAVLLKVIDRRSEVVQPVVIPPVERRINHQAEQFCGRTAHNGDGR